MEKIMWKVLAVLFTTYCILAIIGIIARPIENNHGLIGREKTITENHIATIEKG